jgi:hypothetical protein
MEQDLISALVLLLKEELSKLHLHWKQEAGYLFEIYAKEYLSNRPETDRDMLVKEMVKAIRDRQLERLGRTDSLSSLKLGEILKEDIPLQGSPRLTEKILDELENLKEISRVKHRIRNIAQTIEMQKFRKKRGAGEPLALHLILKGASSEKRTLTVRLLGELFFSMAYLSAAGFTEFPPARAETTASASPVLDILDIKEAFSRALGGILLLNADAMVHGDTASLVEELAEQESANRGKLTMILYGEEAAIKKLFEANPAFKRCFSFTLDFDS